VKHNSILLQEGEGSNQSLVLVSRSPQNQTTQDRSLQDERREKVLNIRVREGETEKEKNIPKAVNNLN
jgi:hypothetical protein